LYGCQELLEQSSVRLDGHIPVLMVVVSSDLQVMLRFPLAHGGSWFGDVVLMCMLWWDQDGSAN